MGTVPPPVGRPRRRGAGFDGYVPIPGPPGEPGAPGAPGSLGSSAIVVGPELPAIPTGQEYVWLQTDGLGNLLDILSGVA